ncbi:uncharacterized protein FIBRA_06464 [Fibroporia radiculosa]|uniref:F-box domain-containing protein n=1 Tax=Fibroporia radiculosa TaxID=599839 RepID=J4GBJ9_9APHY|nr:uncharacterized protein FIBRA_06464 [Fibroporia radiculosa]CCM04293.1 predicted protein [Fibroporia radiculosa]
MTSSLQDLDTLKRHATRVTSVIEIPMPGRDREPFKVDQVEYRFNPESLAMDIMKKYRISSSSLLDEIFSSAEEVKELLSSKSPPIFQELFLLDLPPEIIHRIMEVGEVEVARFLGATCQALYDISQPHKYKELLQDFMFLLSRTDIIRRIRNLSLVIQWSSSKLAMAGLNADNHDDAHVTFFAPIWKSFESVLAHASDIVDLHLSTTVSRQMLLAMAAMTDLCTLKFVDCHLSTRSQTRLPRLASVINASFMFTSDDDDDADIILLLVALLPNLRILYVNGTSRKPFRMHHIGSETRDKSPRRIERIHLAHIAHDQLPVLGLWIRRIAEVNGGRSCLTHFKSQVASGLDRDELFDLVSALRSSPMVALILDGLAYVGQD